MMGFSSSSSPAPPVGRTEIRTWNSKYVDLLFEPPVGFSQNGFLHISIKYSHFRLTNGFHSSGRLWKIQEFRKCLVGFPCWNPKWDF